MNYYAFPLRALQVAFGYAVVVITTVSLLRPKRAYTDIKIGADIFIGGIPK